MKTLWKPCIKLNATVVSQQSYENNNQSHVLQLKQGGLHKTYGCNPD